MWNGSEQYSVVKVKYRLESIIFVLKLYTEKIEKY